MARRAKAKVPRPVVVDFETFGIEGRPHYPPVPVGVSVKYPGKKPRYYAWGHPTGNNCTWDEAHCALHDAWRTAERADGVLFQNGKFDVDVGEVHFGLPRLPWDKYHDTMFLLFLDDPHQKELALKPAAERLLGMPPDERDAVEDWLVDHQPVPGVKVSRSKSSPHYAGRYIAFAPGDVVGPYANGDVDRTEQIFELLYPRTVERGMLAAYDRERRLMPILLEMERQGVPVGLKRLRADVELYSGWRAKIDAWAVKRLKASPGINLNSGAQLVEAMIAAGKCDVDALGVTATGKPKSDKDSLMAAVTDKVLLAVLKYRTQLSTCLDTFMVPWLEVAEASGGFIYTTWNQVKSPKGADSVGTRTGRLSSTPNFQNIPKEFKPIFRHEEADAKKARDLPVCPFKDLPALPMVRSYVVPWDKTHVLLDRDYSQQEPRILAHFDGGSLMDKYNENPWIDFHDYAKAELELMNLFYDRRPVKNTNLGLIYGMGVGKLALKNGQTVEEAKRLKEAILKLYPGLKEMYADMKQRAKANLPARTWGGREFYCEPPAVVDGRLRTFDYKMVNFLIQGSAADCTKEALIRMYETKKPGWRILLNVHDSITMSAPRKEMEEAMEHMRLHMEGVEFDVPMLSEGEWSDTNWNELKTYDKKGRKVHGTEKTA